MLASTTMSSEANKALVRRFVEEVQSKHRLDLVPEIVDPAMIDHYYEMQGLPEPGVDAVEAFRQFYTGILAAFPDVRAEIHLMVAEGDLVITHKTFHVTHRGAFMGMPPSGKKGSVDVIDIFRVAGGKLVEHWGLAGFAALVKQLGGPNRGA